MKAALEIPDGILRRAKSVAAERGIPLAEFVTEAVEDELSANTRTDRRPWVAQMGKRKHLHKEKARVNRLIEEHSERFDSAVRC